VDVDAASGTFATHGGRHLGNFPQAFTHLALINAVMHVIRAESAPAAGGLSPGQV
jgi:alpha,alpha-trehalase